MRVHQYKKFKEETEERILSLANKGWSGSQITDWLHDRLASVDTITGDQLGELLSLIPGIYRAAG